MDTVKQRIISSVFAKRSSAGAPQESYISHVKIWEETEEGGRKPRYILLSQSAAGGFIHKSKMNTNHSFSIGKTWKLPELRGIEVVNSSCFVITLARSYRWQTEDYQEQSDFISAAIRTFRSLTGDRVPLTLVNIPAPGTGTGPPPGDRTGARTPTSSRNVPADRSSPSGVPSASARVAPHTPSSHARPPSPSSSPAPGFIRPESLLSLRSSASSPSMPSIYVPNSPPPISEMPATAPARAYKPHPSAETFQPSLEAPRPSSAAGRQQGASSSRNRRTPSPGHPPSLRPARTPSPVPPPSSAPPAPPQPARARRAESDESPRPQARREPSSSQASTTARKDPHARVSFFDPSNQASLDRLLAATDSKNTSGLEEESAEATLANVEEMLDGYEWASEATVRFGSKRKRGAGDQIEARLHDELTALEKANIYAFLEDDDRVGLVLKYIDDAIHELDSMDTLVSSYKIHLNAVSDDISYIQSQNRGLQVQTQNQKALLTELEQLLQTVNVDRESLIILTQESLEKQGGIHRLETAASELYKALLAGRDTDMAATMERLEEYRTHNSQFCKRLYDFLQIMFSVQSDRTLTDKARFHHELRRHSDLESYLGRYAGLMLYLKEMGEEWYAKVCAAYFSAASGLHNQEMKDLFVAYASLVKKATDEEMEMSFSPPQVSALRGSEPLRRARSMARSPLDARRGGEKRAEGEMRGSEALDHVLRQIGPQIYHEEQFIADFLQINDASLTYADYLNLESYFRRQATRASDVAPGTAKLVRGAMDLIFGFLAGEIKTWVDIALAKDSLQIVGTLVALESAMNESEDRGNNFWTKVLQKQHQRVRGLYDRHVDEQIRAIEQTKLTTKKRKGVAHFIKYFPVYVGRVENQLIGSDILDVRATVDTAYEKIVQSMFDSLKHMAKMEGEGEDKGQLNYHVELVENMHYFITEITQQDVGNVKSFLRQAQTIYDENLNAYIKLILRRPLAKILDYFDGVERLLKSSSPSGVSSNSSYNKSSLKRVVKEYNAKDMRRHVDALFKRVEKHYADPGEEHAGNNANLFKGVWTACEQEVVKSTERFSRLIAQCYKETGVSLEYTTQEVEASFRRHRAGG
ncbi:exocyst complex component Sec3-domain-containing protein [Gautieria morchelliformis]|nr:exocyst complex component Sec3-domain-containing protein [Gautieria morchelliformis]